MQVRVPSRILRGHWGPRSMANNNMLNNFFGGLTGAAGGGGPTTTAPLGRSSLFDDADVVSDFTDHLRPVPGGATIT